MKDKLKAGLLYPLPHHALSRLIFWLTRRETPYAQAVMRWFARRYGVEMAEARAKDFSAYPSFNAFFTRELEKGAREIDPSANSLACPVDGAVSQAGHIENGQIFQAKAHSYSLLTLVGGREEDAAPFTNGKFATLYLSPGDYHRIHMPIDATLTKMVHVPGRLFSVAPFTVDNVPGLFARNERVVALFDTPAGRLGMVLVGAINVAAIETVWAGLITPPTRSSIARVDYPPDSAPTFAKGDEMGRFNMGSTVILLTEHSVQFNALMNAGRPVRVGQSIGQFSTE